MDVLGNVQRIVTLHGCTIDIPSAPICRVTTATCADKQSSRNSTGENNGARNTTSHKTRIILFRGVRSKLGRDVFGYILLDNGTAQE